MKIGFIGLGIMGKPMALNILAGGYPDLYVWNRSPGPAEVLVKAGAAAASKEQIGRECDVILTMLPNSPQVKSVMLGPDGVAQYMHAGQVYIDMSSINPVSSREIASELEKAGVEMLDAPVSGGEPKAVDGTLSFMVGGKQDVFDRMKPLLLTMGSSVTLCGSIGAGNTAKLANQIMVALHLSAVAEAMVFAEKAGVDPEKVYQAIRGGLAGSTVLDAKMDRILDRNFKPGGPIWMHTKDLLNVRDAALAIDAPIPLTTQVLEAFKACKCDGHVNDDHCGVIQYWEKLANVTVKRR